jgi:hypothetical protein
MYYPLSFLWLASLFIAIPIVFLLWRYTPSRIAQIVREGTSSQQQTFARKIATLCAFMCAGSTTIIFLNDWQTEAWVNNWFDAVAFFVAGFSAGLATACTCLDYIIFRQRQHLVQRATELMSSARQVPLAPIEFGADQDDAA